MGCDDWKEWQGFSRHEADRKHEESRSAYAGTFCGQCAENKGVINGLCHSCAVERVRLYEETEAGCHQCEDAVMIKDSYIGDLSPSSGKRYMLCAKCADK